MNIHAQECLMAFLSKPEPFTIINKLASLPGIHLLCLTNDLQKLKQKYYQIRFTSVFKGVGKDPTNVPFFLACMQRGWQEVYFSSKQMKRNNMRIQEDKSSYVSVKMQTWLLRWT